MPKLLSTHRPRWLLRAACPPCLAWLPGCGAGAQPPLASVARFEPMPDGPRIGAEVGALRSTRVIALHRVGGPGDGSGRSGALTRADDRGIYALSRLGGAYGGAVFRIDAPL